MVWFLCIVLALGLTAPSVERQARIERLESSLLAPCCYREPLSRHQSEAAVKMRLEIRNWIDAGKSDDEILSVYKQRYGDQVLAVPAQAPRWWTDGIPWLLTLLGAAAVVWLVARWRSRAPLPAAAGNGSLPALPESEEDWDRILPTSQK